MHTDGGTKKIQKAIAEVEKKKKKKRSTEHFWVKPWVMNELNCVIHEFHIWHMDWCKQNHKWIVNWKEGKGTHQARHPDWKTFASVSC